MLKSLDEYNSLLTQKLQVSSLSKKRRIAYDLGTIYSVYEMFGVRKNLPNYSQYLNGTSLTNETFKNVDSFSSIAKSIINVKEVSSYYNYRLFPYDKISDKDNNIIKEFFNYFLPKLSNIFRELYNDDRILFVSNLTTAGFAIPLIELDKYFIAISSDDNYGLETFTTLIHELLHVYSLKFLKNYRFSVTRNLIDGLFCEAVSLYGELSFLVFLLNKHILSEEALILLNLFDNILFDTANSVNLFSKIIDSPNIYIKFDNTKYELYDLGTSEEENTLCKGDFVDFSYIVGFVEAYNLLYKELNGANIEKSINSFLLELDDPYLFEKKYCDGVDLSFMQSEITKRNVLLDKKYPGYKPEY